MIALHSIKSIPEKLRWKKVKQKKGSDFFLKFESRKRKKHPSKS